MDIDRGNREATVQSVYDTVAAGNNQVSFSRFTLSSQEAPLEGQLMPTESALHREAREFLEQLEQRF